MECCKCNSFLEDHIYYVCQSCDSKLCQVCADVHLVNELDCDANLLNNDGLSIEICADHGKIVVSFCNECESLICSTCIVSIKTCTHPLPKSYSQLQCEFYHKVYEVINSAEDTIKSCENSIKLLNVMSAGFIATIQSRFSTLHDCLDEMQANILNDIKLNCNFFHTLEHNRRRLEHCNDILMLATSFLDTSFYENAKQLAALSLKLSGLEYRDIESRSIDPLKFDFARFKDVVLKKFELEVPLEIPAKRRKVINDQDIMSSDESFNSSDSLQTVSVTVEQLASQDDDIKLRSVKMIRNKYSYKEKCKIDSCIDEGLLNHILRFIQDEYNNNPNLQYESCWLLTNITSLSTLHTLSVVGIGCLPHLIKLLDAPNENVKHQALWTLGNIIVDGYILRDQCIEAGVLSSVVDQLSTKREPEFLLTAAWFFGNVCRHLSHPIKLSCLKQILDELEFLIEMKVNDLTRECFWAFTFICDSPLDYKQEFINRGLLALTVCKMQSENEDRFCMPLVKTLTNLASSETILPLLVNTQLFGCLRTFLTHKRLPIRKETYILINRVTSLGSDAVQLLIESDLMPVIVEDLLFDDRNVALAASEVIKNAFKFADESQLGSLWSHSHALCSMFTSAMANLDKSLLVAVRNLLQHTNDLEEVRNVLEEEGVVETLESLQSHEDKELTLISKELLCNFFDKTSSEDEEEC